MARGAPSEAKLTAKIQKALVLRYGGRICVWKIHGSMFQTAGIPDLVGVVDGRFLGLEVKLPGKEDTLSAIQQLMLSRIARAGGICSMVTSVEQSISVIEKALKKPPGKPL